jgi:hypothetical protein
MLGKVLLRQTLWRDGVICPRRTMFNPGTFTLLGKGSEHF